MMSYDWYGSADNVAGLFFGVGAVGVMGLRYSQDRVVNSQLAALRVSLLLKLLLLMLMELLLRLTDSAVTVAVARSANLHWLLALQTATIGTVGR